MKKGAYPLFASTAWGVRFHLALLVFAALLPLAGLQTYDTLDRFERHAELARVYNRERASAIAVTVGTMVNENRALLTRLAARPGMEVEDPVQCDPLLAALHGLGHQLANVALTNRAGDVVCSAVPPSGGRRINIGERPDFRSMLETGSFSLSEPFIGPISSEWVVAQLLPRRGGDGHIIGGVGAPLALKAVQRLIQQILQHPDQIAYLISVGGRLVSTSDESAKRIGQAILGTPLAEAALRQALRTFEAPDLDGRARYFSAEPVPGTSWIALVGFTRDKALATAVRSLQVALAGLLIALALAFTGIWLIGRKITGPIRQLAASAGAVSTGQTDARASVAGPTEVAEVARQFNAMLDTIEQETAALRQSERAQSQLAAIVKSSNDAIVSRAPDGTIVSWNAAAERMFGWSEQEALGQPFRDIVRQESSAPRQGRFERLLHGEETVDAIEDTRLRKDGSPISVHTTMSAVRDEHGTIIFVASIMRDISDLKRAEAALREINIGLEQRVAERTAELTVAKARAESSDRLKSAFLATMSHELRTPLNSIIGFTGIILQGLAGPLNPEQAKQLGMVQVSARHLLALINDVLDISKIEAGGLKVGCEPFDLRASIARVVDIVTPLAATKGLALRAEVAPAIGEVAGDARRVEQVLLNLVNNAIKFTERGEIVLNAALSGDAVRIRISDTGIGIKLEDMHTLFQPFRQVDDGLARNHEGTGLGLAICLRLAELMGSEIQAESEWGKGSVFTFTLPLGKG